MQVDFFGTLRDKGVAFKTGEAYMVGNVGVEIHSIRPDYKDDVLNVLRQDKHRANGLEVGFDPIAQVHTLHVNGNLVGAVQD